MTGLSWQPWRVGDGHHNMAHAMRIMDCGGKKDKCDVAGKVSDGQEKKNRGCAFSLLDIIVFTIYHSTL